MKKTSISILGCGWLGIPLAKALISDGYLVKGSTTSSEKLAILVSAKIEAFLISIDEKSIVGNIGDFLQSDFLIIDIPPKLRSRQIENFVKKIGLLRQFIEKSKIKNVVFVSSTSVFGDQQGVVDENTLPEPDSESGRQLLASENLLRQSTHFKTTLLRFGGLIGPNRHPIHFLSGRKTVSPNAAVNLIHLEDCIGIVQHIIAHQLWGETFHGVSPQHPSKESYYSQIAQQLGLRMPKFEQETEAVQHKIVNSIRLNQTPRYHFIFCLTRNPTSPKER